MRRIGKTIHYYWRWKVDFYQYLFDDHTLRRQRRTWVTWTSYIENFTYAIVIFWLVTGMEAAWEKYKIERHWKQNPGKFPPLAAPVWFRSLAPKDFVYHFSPGMSMEDILVEQEMKRIIEMESSKDGDTSAIENRVPSIMKEKIE